MTQISAALEQLPRNAAKLANRVSHGIGRPSTRRLASVPVEAAKEQSPYRMLLETQARKDMLLKELSRTEGKALDAKLAEIQQLKAEERRLQAVVDEGGSDSFAQETLDRADEAIASMRNQRKVVQGLIKDLDAQNANPAQKAISEESSNNPFIDVSAFECQIIRDELAVISHDPAEKKELLSRLADLTQDPKEREAILRELAGLKANPFSGITATSEKAIAQPEPATDIFGKVIDPEEFILPKEMFTTKEVDDFMKNAEVTYDIEIPRGQVFDAMPVAPNYLKMDSINKEEGRQAKIKSQRIQDEAATRKALAPQKAETPNKVVSNEISPLWTQDDARAKIAKLEARFDNPNLTASNYVTLAAEIKRLEAQLASDSTAKVHDIDFSDTTKPDANFGDFAIENTIPNVKFADLDNENTIPNAQFSMFSTEQTEQQPGILNLGKLNDKPNQIKAEVDTTEELDVADCEFEEGEVAAKVADEVVATVADNAPKSAVRLVSSNPQPASPSDDGKTVRRWYNRGFFAWMRGETAEGPAKPEKTKKAANM